MGLLEELTTVFKAGCRQPRGNAQLCGNAQVDVKASFLSNRAENRRPFKKVQLALDVLLGYPLQGGGGTKQHIVTLNMLPHGGGRSPWPEPPPTIPRRLNCNHGP